MTTAYRGPLTKFAAAIEHNPASFAKALLGAYVRKDAGRKRLDALLQEAEEAYTNRLPIISDRAYDALHEFLTNAAEPPIVDKPEKIQKVAKRVGAPVPANDTRKVTIPHWMGSMDKVKDGRGLAAWQREFPGDCIVSDKLDGVSALVVVQPDKTMRMFSRGDGRIGQDITGLVPILGMGGFSSKALEPGTAVRGELIVTRSDFANSLSGRMANARNAVAGLVNSKKPDLDTATVVGFVAYELVKPNGLAIGQQLSKLKSMGFTTVWHQKLKKGFSSDELRGILLKRKQDSPFEIDGLIVQHDQPGHIQESGGNPQYAFAFKSLDAQETSPAHVIEVEWNASKDGLLKPTVLFQPIRISGVTIQRATGFNAEFIEQNNIGPGAVIEVTRSGDVIPYILRVITPAPKGAQMPSDDWQWGATRKDAVLVSKGSREVQVKLLASFFKSLGTFGVAEKSIEKMYDAGYTTVKKVLNVKPEQLQHVEGFSITKASSTCEAVRQAVDKASCVQLMDASNAFGPGFGERKLKAVITGLGVNGMQLAAGNKDPTMNELLVIPGVQQKTAEGFVAGLKEFRRFLKEQGLSCSAVAVPPAPPVAKQGQTGFTGWVEGVMGKGKNVVFTGVRSQTLERLIESLGGVVKSSVSINTDVVVFADRRGKYEKAVELSDTRVQRGKTAIVLVAWPDVQARAEKVGFALK